MAGAIASAVLFAFPAFAQDSRLSLADRVTRLEQQTQNRDQSGTGMVNQMQQLQAQVQQLQGQIEELQHQMQELQDKGKAQYTDLDARLQRLEGGNAGAAAAGNNQPPGLQPVPVNAPAAATTSNGGAAPMAADTTSSAAATADPAAAQAAYDTAFKAIRSGDYANASRQFRSFIQQYPNHALVPNAWYWLGESYYVTTNYQVALEAFQHLVSQFPQSDKASEGLLKVGYCQYELKQMDAAKATLQQVSSKYPGSKVASLAQERLQRMQLQAAN
jgi:tol-pal system protein YbgF